MTQIKSTIDKQEVDKFAQHAQYWWDLKGPLKTLHDINNIRLAFIDKHLPLNNCYILDVGCGGGILSEGMAHLGATVTGIDAAQEAIQAAKEHAEQQQVAITYECTAIEDYEHSGFDAITCMELLEHVQNPEVVIEHCNRLLKPGGLLFLSTISRTLKAYASAVLAAEYILGIVPKQTHEYNKFLKPSELAFMARAIGLKVIDLKGLNYNPILKTAALSDDVSVNYFLVVQKAEAVL